MTDRDSVQRWLDGYSKAWETYDAATIAGLFAEDAEYRYHPWGEPVRGREAIVRDWIEPQGDASSRDKPGTYEGRYEPYAVDGDRAVAVGRSTYWTDETRSAVERIYENVFLLEFAADGRCRSFTEVFLKRPAEHVG